MSAAVVIDLAYAVVLVGAAVVLFRLCRTRLTAAQRVVDDALASLPPAYRDLDLDAGLDRLRDAIREQQEGD